MSTEIKTVKIKQDAMAPNKLLINGQEQSTAHKRSTKKSGEMWAQTLLLIAAEVDLSSFEGQEAEDVSKLLKGIYDSLMGAHVPETGLNNNGKEVKLRKNDGTVMYRSYPATKVSYGYTSDIAKIATAGVSGDVLVGELEVMARNQALALAKTPETPLKTIQRCSELILKKFEEINTKDKNECNDMIAAIEKAWAIRAMELSK